MTWIAGAWGVFMGLVLSLATTFFSESGPTVGSTTLSVGVLIAVLGLPFVVVLTARLAESGWTGLAAWSAWMIGTVTLGTKTHSGSLLLLGDTSGSAVLYSGALIGAVAVGIVGTRIRPRPSPLKRPALPVAPVDDDDTDGGQGVTQPV